MSDYTEREGEDKFQHKSFLHTLCVMSGPYRCKKLIIFPRHFATLATALKLNKKVWWEKV